MTYSVTSPGGKVRVEVFQDGITSSFHKRQDGRPFIPVTVGRPYYVRVINCAFTRIEVAVSIDGRNALRDEPADYDSPGLVIHAGGHYDFRGWRVDDNTTREFIFGDPGKSVAAQAGDASNIGVIGIAAWREEVVPEWKPWAPGASGDFLGGVFAGGSPRSYRNSSYAGSGWSAGSSNNAPAASAGDETYDMNMSSVGTGIGVAQTDRVARTRFTRTGTPDILVIGYDTREELCRKGIISEYRDPEPFPGSKTGYEKYRS